MALRRGTNWVTIGIIIARLLKIHSYDFNDRNDQVLVNKLLGELYLDVKHSYRLIILDVEVLCIKERRNMVRDVQSGDLLFFRPRAPLSQFNRCLLRRHFSMIRLAFVYVLHLPELHLEVKFRAERIFTETLMFVHSPCIPEVNMKRLVNERAADFELQNAEVKVYWGIVIKFQLVVA